MTKGPTPMGLQKLFWDRVRKTDTCWEWLGHRGSNGRGRLYVWFMKKSMSAYRLSFYLHRGFLPPPGLVLMHSCDNGWCVNPSHLSVGTHKDNQQDSLRKGRSYFSRIKGADHPRSYLKENSVIRAKIVEGALPAKDVAAAIGCSQSMVFKIYEGKAWKHLGTKQALMT